MFNTKFAIGAALAGAFVLGAIAVGFSSAQTDRADQTERGAQTSSASQAPMQSEMVETSFSDGQEDEIRDLVRAYLLDNPEVIIEAVNLYSQRQQMAGEERTRAAAVQNIDYLLDPATSFVAGKNVEKAKVAVVELYDYHCGYCKRAADFITNLAKSDADVKVVFRELPLLREESGYAAEMSLASRAQGKFLDFHNALLGASGVLTKDRVQKIAREQGLDVKKMEAAIDDENIVGMIANNHALAEALGVDYTPAFIVASTNGEYVEVVSGNQQDVLKEKIEEAKKAAG
ncbi:DsbA family protein [Hyphococcus sp.]|uniref:DsbA family protein n=1 Tax=Hyphococcus sp. TaxID=2038636 RepID=UPI003CCB79E7